MIMDVGKMAVRLNKVLFLIVVSTTVCLELSSVFAFGALYLALLEEYHNDRSTTAIVQSLLVGVSLSFGVFSGALITKLGLPAVVTISCVLAPSGLCVSFFATSVQYLYVSTGICGGMGISLLYVSGIVAFGRIFTGKQQFVALTILTCTDSIFGIAYPYFLNYLVRRYGVKGTFLILGGMFCNSFLFCLICWTNRTSMQNTNITKKGAANITNPQDEIQSQTREMDLQTEARHESSEEAKAKTLRDKQKTMLRYLRSLLRIPYVALLLGMGIYMSSLNGFLSIVLDIAKWKGLTESQGISSLVFINTFAFISRSLPSILKQFKGFSSFAYLTITAVCGLMGQVVMYVSQSYAVFCLATCLDGIALGGIISMTIIIVVKIMPVEQVPIASGLLFTINGLLSTGAGPLFGRIRDTTNSYQGVLFTVGGVQLLGVVLFVVALVARRHEIKTAREQ